MIIEALGTGAETARTAKELCDILRLERKNFYAEVETERRAENPICASRGAVPGYYLARTKEEAQSYYRLTEKTARELRKTARAVRKAAEGLPNE